MMCAAAGGVVEGGQQQLSACERAIEQLPSFHWMLRHKLPRSAGGGEEEAGVQE